MRVAPPATIQQSNKYEIENLFYMWAPASQTPHIVTYYQEFRQFKGHKLRFITLRDLSVEFKVIEQQVALQGQEQLTAAVTLNLKSPQGLVQ